jgi:hypothetical protein
MCSDQHQVGRRPDIVTAAADRCSLTRAAWREAMSQCQSLIKIVPIGSGCVALRHTDWPSSNSDVTKVGIEPSGRLEL